MVKMGLVFGYGDCGDGIYTRDERLGLCGRGGLCFWRFCADEGRFADFVSQCDVGRFPFCRVLGVDGNSGFWESDDGKSTVVGECDYTRCGGGGNVRALAKNSPFCPSSFWEFWSGTDIVCGAIVLCDF